jgi:CRISPR-associated protein Csh1
VQDRAIVEIGKLELEKQVDLKPYQLYVEEITPGKVCSMAVVLFEQNEDKLLFKHVDYAKVNEENFQRFGYRKGSARGGDITFTTKFGDLEKKFGVLLNTQWPNLLFLAEKNYPDEYQLIKSWKIAFEDNKQRIQSELQGFHAGLKKEEQLASAFTLAIEKNGQRKLITDFQSVQQTLLLNGTEGKKTKYKVTSEGKNSACSICLKHKEVLYGFASPFKYATVDKPGTVSGFFNQKNNWINYPICEHCALEFEFGKNYTTKSLTRSFFGHRYFLIPKTVLSNDKKSLNRALQRIKEISYSTDKKSSIERNEDYLMRKIGEMDNSITFNFLFFEENPTTKAIKIKLMLEEIPPSRFRTLFIDAPGKINSHPFYELADYLFKNKEKTDLKFSFGIIKQFFDNTFFDTVNKVFLGKQINRQEVFSRVMQVLRVNHNKKMTSDGFVEQSQLTILKAHLLLRYLETLNIIKTPNSSLMIEEAEEDNRSHRSEQKSFDLKKLKYFMTQNSEFIYSNHIAGIFSLGVMVRVLLDIQKYELGSTPFEKKLKGYDLSANDLHRIFKECLDKINKYRSIYTHAELREFVTENFATQKPKIDKMTNNELSFYFVTGLELGRKFKTEKAEE